MSYSGPGEPNSNATPKDMTDKPAAPQPDHLVAFRALAKKWDAAVLKLKAGVADSPSHDLKRMIRERAEAFDICIAELRALIAEAEKGAAYAKLEALADSWRHRGPHEWSDVQRKLLKSLDGKCERCQVYAAIAELRAGEGRT